jgi:hypothetical protein
VHSSPCFLLSVRYLSPSEEVSVWANLLPKFYHLFFFSGFPALIYQIMWERALFGVNVESGNRRCDRRDCFKAILDVNSVNYVVSFSESVLLHDLCIATEVPTTSVPTPLSTSRIGSTHFRPAPIDQVRHKSPPRRTSQCPLGRPLLQSPLIYTRLAKHCVTPSTLFPLFPPLATDIPPNSLYYLEVGIDIGFESDSDPA